VKRATVAVAAVLVLAATAVIVPSVTIGAPFQLVSAGSPAPSVPPAQICSSPVLNSPWSYTGTAGSYTSGTAGLPTFGSAGTDFPAATAGLVVAAGDNSSAAQAGAYQVNSTVVYFEPGKHVIQATMYTGHDSYYTGGYTAAAGRAVLDGLNGGTASGNGGTSLDLELASANHTTNDTWEYLTIQNYTSSTGGAVMGAVNGGGFAEGNTYKYDTIGPNEYEYTGSSSPPAHSTTSAPGQGGGYAIEGGSYTTIEYDCLTDNAEGGFNISGAAGVMIASNEISRNGLGEYPDNPGTGESPYSCGCSGGGKLFYTVNADVVNNYVHDNYNDGIWFDFDNTGVLISHNYVASNWAAGIQLEASYNANIADNTLTGNGWASHGPWPAGVGNRERRRFPVLRDHPD